MKIQFDGWESTMTPPDSDGDVWVRGAATIEIKGEGSVDQVVLSHLVRDEQGRPVKLDISEEDEELAPGDTGQFETRTWIKGGFDGGIGQLTIELRSADYLRFGGSNLPGLGETVGSSTPVAMECGLNVLGWSVMTDATPDDDGEVWSNLLLILEHHGQAPLSQVEAKMVLTKRSGEELDDGIDSKEGILPGQRIGLEPCCRFHSRWLTKGVTLEIRLKATSVVASETAEPSTLELRAR